MAQNLWKLAGKPTSFNPLPTGTNNDLMVNTGTSYRVRFYAYSPTSANLQMANWTASPYKTITLTPTRTYYEFDVVGVNGHILFYDVNTKGDIVVDSIEVVKTPLPQLPTLHNLSRSRRVGSLTSEVSFTDEKILSLSKVSLNGVAGTKQGTATIKANYDGKVGGYTDLIPHIGKYHNSMSTLLPPTGSWASEISQTSYNSIAKQDGTNATPAGNANTNGSFAQNLFSFDLIRLMTDKFGSEFFADCVDTAAKVTKLKNLLTRIQADWYGYGTTVLSNYSGTTDFASKVASSVVENANIFKRTWSAGRTSMLTPATAPDSTFGEVPAGDYTAVTTVDSNISGSSSSLYGAISQHLFSFNLIEYVKRKYGFTPDVAWLKANVTKLTANWWGYGTNAQANPTGLANFANKVAGSVVENPNLFKWSKASTLTAPTGAWTEMITADYTAVSTQDGSVNTSMSNVNGQYSQVLFSFDLISYIQTKYGVTVPGADTAAKVAWLKANINTLQFNWWGYGSSPTGNKASVTVWKASTQAWSNQVYHTNAGVSRLIFNVLTTGGNLVTDDIDANGFIHFIAFSDPSDGTTQSTIKTDYVELDITINAGGNKATIAQWRSADSIWMNTNSHTNSTVTTLAIYDTFPNDKIDANGFVHFLTYADASNGISPSVINTDYVNLIVEVDAGSNKAYLKPWYASDSSWHDWGMTHANGTVTKLSAGTYTSMANLIDASGMTHWVAYTDPSNGVKTSTLNTDYIELAVDVNLAETGYDVYVDTVSSQFPKLPDNMVDARTALPVEPSVFTVDASSTITADSLGVLKIVNGGVGGTATEGLEAIIAGNLAPGSYYWIADVKGTGTITSYNIGTGITTVSQPNSVVLDPSNWKTISGVITIAAGQTGQAVGFRIRNGIAATQFTCYLRNVKFATGATPDVWTPGRIRKKTLNFLGKVAGSIDQVPHRSMRSVASSFVAPPFAGENVQAQYDGMAKQSDGSMFTYAGATVAGGYSQQLFEFDLSHLGLSLADLKLALRSYTLTWVGYGVGDNAGVQTYGASLRMWNPGASTWTNYADWTNTSSTPTAIIKNQTEAPPTIYWGNYITSDQKIYILAHSTYPAGTSGSSAINTDYVKLDITLADWVDYVKTNGVKVKQTDSSKVKLAFPNTRDVVDIDYVKNDTRVYPKLNMIPPYSDSRWQYVQASFNAPTDRDVDVTSVTNGGGIFIYLPVTTGKTYTLSVDPVVGGIVQAYKTKSIGGSAWFGGAISPRTFTVDDTFGGFMTVKLENSGIGTVRYSKVTLVEGSSVQPWAPYELIGGFRNVISSRKVPKKNVYSSAQMTLMGGATNVVNSGTMWSWTTNNNYQGIKPVTMPDLVMGRTYTLSFIGDRVRAIHYYTGGIVGSSTAMSGGKVTLTFTVSNLVNANILYFENAALGTGNSWIDQIQIEEGSINTPYEDYQLLDARPSKPGLVMDGITTSIGLPSMTLDAIELDCIVDSYQPQGLNGFVIDARNGFNGYVSQGANVIGFSMSVNGGDPKGSWTDIPKGQRVKLKFYTSTPFTDNVTIFGDSINNRQAKGIIYGIKCYLNGQVVKEYDATALAQLSGGKLLPKSKDLVPDFDNAGWNLHANALVYGKEWVRLNATAAWQMSYIDIPVVPNQGCLLVFSSPQFSGNTVRADYLDANKSTIGYLNNNPLTSAVASVTGTTPANCTAIRIYMQNNLTGLYEFKKPQLFLTDGTEAQVFGTPLPKVRTPRRVLYNIR